MLAAALAVGATVAVLLPRALVGVFYDDGIYLALAKSLAEGRGYRLLFLPGAPAAVHYPFAYPAFLAALWAIWPRFPGNVVLLRAANAVLMAVFAALAAGYFARRAGPPRWATVTVIVLAATAAPVLAMATVLFAEPLFLALAVAACWTTDAATARAGRGESGAALRLACLAGVLAGTTALTRSIGAAVVFGISCAFITARRRRLLAVALLPAACLLTPWFVWVRVHHAAVDPATASGYGTYTDFVRQAGVSWLSPSSLADIGRPLGAVALPALPAPWRLALGVPALAVLVVGMVALTRRAPAAGWMLWWYLAVVAVWPYGPDRFLWGIFPVLGVAFAAGVHALLARAATAARVGMAVRVLALTGAATVVIGFGAFQARQLARGGATATQRGISAAMSDVLPWIRASTDTNAVIASEDEPLIWLYTGRRAVPSFLWRVRGRSSESFGPDTLFAYLERSGATHLVLTGLGAEGAPTVDALLARRPGYLQMVRVWPGPRFAFRIRRGG